uniref:Uncharacterized protein n=1 Tax=Moniliophthora roreri TaxID=221103 RepID=A0A0W0FYB9_MONRR
MRFIQTTSYMLQSPAAAAIGLFRVGDYGVADGSLMASLADPIKVQKRLIIGLNFEYPHFSRRSSPVN